MYFVVWAVDHAGVLDARLNVRAAHRERLRDPAPHAVRVMLGGPTLDPDTGCMAGSLLVIEAQDIEAVQAFVASDPYVREGVYASVTIRPWQWGLGAPGAGDRSA
jgi:uncharacterized protein